MIEKVRLGDQAASVPSLRLAPTRHVNCDPHGNDADCQVVTEAAVSAPTTVRP